MSIIPVFFFLLLIIFPRSICAARGGQWQLLQKSIGISAMHMQLLNDDRVLIFDRTDFGPSNVSLPNGLCRNNPHDLALKTDCTAHSVEYDSLSNTFRPLNVLTDTWCSSGATLPNGTLVQTGGYNDGERVVRTFQPSCDVCDWVELPNKLLIRRWYATNHILPDGRLIVIGGRRAFNYEFYPKTTRSTSQLYKLPFLAQTNVHNAENNLYPFVFLHVDGNLFIFANNRAILLDYVKNVVVRTYPIIPGGDPRSYPSSGSAVLLPLKDLELGLNVEAEVLICGGAPLGSYLKAHSRQFLPALNTCARIKINDPNPTWAIETMPMARVMSDMVILPNEDILLINGAGSGSAGWELGRDPVLNPVIYHPSNVLGSRFELHNPTQVPRMYHSSAILLRDGRILVGGSNPHKFNNFTNVLYPTELSLEAFSPPYLDPSKVKLRPIIVTPASSSKIQYGKLLEVKFTITGLIDLDSIRVTMISPPFNTHSFSMSQRLLVLTNATPAKPMDSGRFQVNVRTPGSINIAPPGFYMLFVVHQNVPSVGIWVQLM
ncbi:aldehyde oxidase GLOX-like [Chenopodium quinoa]|uniref:aldehyde oxidase GLOX-like n=1 Tax=Chenopodium quinoa TaxID=63459 RepID=UPI000B79581D|nr:aldehyde oxidase GLOX-like [Chenopodium quinoa]